MSLKRPAQDESYTLEVSALYMLHRQVVSCLVMPSVNVSRRDELAGVLGGTM
jgi:hypothetical protein